MSIVTRPITVDEYERMVAAGVFEPGARLELIEGALVTMPPQSPEHAGGTHGISERLRRAIDAADLSALILVREHSPIRLFTSEPEPDIVLARRDAQGYRSRHPDPADCLLVVEVSHTSLEADRTKFTLYGQAAIAAAWVVDLVHRRVIVGRDPDPTHGYLSVQTYHVGERIPVAELPHEIPVDDLFGA
jgi:Uma2 family endonuclease